MAEETKWKKFLDKWDDDEEIRRVLLNHVDTLKGARDDDEKVQIALSLLRNEMEGWDKKKYDDLWREWGGSREDAGFVYSPSTIASEFGYKDRTVGKDEKISGLDEFREKYWKLDRDGREYWKDRFERKHGKGTWEHVKRIMRNDLKEQSLRQTEKDRAEIMEGRDGVGEWLLSAAMGLVSPRIKNAYKEGRNPGAREILGDVAENAAYAAMPVGAIGRVAGKGIARVLPKRTASKLLGGALAEFAAPTAVELADYGLGNSDAIEPADIIIGGATNLGVNRGLGRLGGATLGMLGKKASVGRLPKPLRERLEGVKSTKERADELVEDARKTLEAASVSDAEAYRNIVRNSEDLPGLGEQQEAINILRTAENADRPRAERALQELKDEVEVIDADIKEHTAKLNDVENRQQGFNMTHEAGMDNFSDETAKGLNEVLDMQKNQEMGILEGLGTRKKEYTERIGQLEKAVKAGDVLSGLSDQLSQEQLFTRMGVQFDDLRLLHPLESPMKKLESDLGIPEGTLQRHNELLGLFGKEIKPTKKERALEALMQWSVNRAGTDSDAQILNTVSQGLVDPKKLRESQYEQREERKDRRAADVLRTDGYTGEDLKYLKMIAEKPSIMTYGLRDEKENNAFKNWLMLRGNDILMEQDSPLARRTFAVE
jgi:hypothetical protein